MTRTALMDQFLEMARRIPDLPDFIHIKTIHAFGSFVEGKEKPNDLDLLVHAECDHDAWRVFADAKGWHTYLDDSPYWTKYATWILRGKAGRNGSGGKKVLTGLSIGIETHGVRREDGNHIGATRYMLLWKDGSIVAEKERVVLTVVAEQVDDVDHDLRRCEEGLEHEIKQKLQNMVKVRVDKALFQGRLYGKLVVSWPNGEEILEYGNVDRLRNVATDARKLILHSILNGIGNLKWSARVAEAKSSWKTHLESAKSATKSEDKDHPRLDVKCEGERCHHSYYYPYSRAVEAETILRSVGVPVGGKHA